jgi:TIR domain/SIR2-like domain
MADFLWDEVIDALVRHHNVVPVIGEELLSIESEGRRAPFPRLLAQSLARRQGLTSAPDLPSLSDVVVTLRNNRVPIIRITSALMSAFKELIDQLGERAVPESLRLLAEIDDLSLFISTTPDDLMLRALRVRDPRAHAAPYSLNDGGGPLREGLLRDGPFVVQIFGALSTEGGFALTEEDVLEYVCSLQTDRRPEVLLDRLKIGHLLFIGTGFPDWMMRLFMRTLRANRFSEDSGKVRALAAGPLNQERSLVWFLTSFSTDTVIYEADPAEFVRELHRRWKEQRAVAGAPPAVVGQPADIPDGAIFISYSRQGDLAAATRVKESLGTRKLPAWFDLGELGPGDAWERRIEDGIRSAHLFVPLLSRSCLARTEGFFVREWNLALKRNDMMKNRAFIVPIIIDDLAESELEKDDVARRFGAMNITRAPGGLLTEAQLDGVVERIRKARS